MVMGIEEGKVFCWVRDTARLLVGKVPPGVAKTFNRKEANSCHLTVSAMYGWLSGLPDRKSVV